jgi:hemin uptake protein HemP
MNQRSSLAIPEEGSMIPAMDEEKRSPANAEARRSGVSTRSVAIVDNRIDSRDLFVASREIIIGHGEDQYRLRLTSQNKLILTK